LFFLVNAYAFTTNTIILWDLNDVLLTPSRLIDPLLYQDDFQELAIQFRGTKKIIPGMYEIVKELYDLGYEQHIASNISPQAFAFLTDATKNPQLQALFSLINIKKSITYIYHHGTIIKKPHVEYFEFYLKKNNISVAQTTVLLIDDKHINIQGAKLVGIKGIQFKSPFQLRNELKSFGIPLQTNEDCTGNYFL
jgi:FMN phosphatase YigB (HAD superfamily)